MSETTPASRGDPIGTPARARRRSSSHSHSPRHRSRPLPPVNPPDPPATLLSYINSRAVYDQETAAAATEAETGEGADRALDTDADTGRRGQTARGRLGEGDTGAVGLDGGEQGGARGADNAKQRSWYSRYARRLGRGMYDDVRARAPYYMSDWTDAWNYRVVPATWVCLLLSLSLCATLL